MPSITTIADRVQEWAPFDLSNILGPLYYQYLSLQANREHETLNHADRTPDSDVPDHVLVVVIDALRPDHLPDLPLEFDQAVAPGTWTFPSVTSMQTGLTPHEHGSVAHTHPEDDHFVIPQQYKSRETLPHCLEAAGFDTYLGSAFITPFLALRGWFRSNRVYGDVPAESVLNDYRSWRSNRDRTYAYLHLGDLHAPIDPPNQYVHRRNVDTSLDGLDRLVKYTDNYEDAPENWREQRLRLYCAALDYVEDTLRPVIEEIRDDTMIIITGDHGEAMWEHPDLDRQFADSRPNYCVGHGGTPFDTVARVPVAIECPAENVSIEGGLANGRDIPKTVCDGLGIDYQFPGQSWFNPIPDDRATLCEATRYGTERKAVYRGDSKIIRSETDDVTLDATVHPEGGETFGTLEDTEIEALIDCLPNHWDDVDLSTETSDMVEDRLEALGYK